MRADPTVRLEPESVSYVQNFSTDAVISHLTPNRTSLAGETP